MKARNKENGEVAELSIKDNAILVEFPEDELKNYTITLEDVLREWTLKN